MAAEANDLLKKTEVLASGARLVAVNLNIELHKWLCQYLQETLDLVEKDLSDPSTRGRCRKILRELLKVAKKVNSLVRDCCYNEREETEFIIAAIRLTDSAERFLLYHVELCWCRFLVGYMGKEDSAVKDLGGFDWNERLRSVRGEPEFSRARDADRAHMVIKLNNSLERGGDHRRICKSLLLRFGNTVSLDDEPVPSLSDKIYIKKGGQASVWKVKWKDKAFALKIFNNVDDVKAFRKEADVFRTCSHPHILNMICSFEENKCGKIMMDLMSKDLHGHINDKEFNALEHVDMILQVAQGMSYLHEQNVVHRDLKPQNILLKVDPEDVMDPVLKVADFGLAKIRESLSSLSDNTPNVGTIRYRAPELYQNRHQEGAGTGRVMVESKKADVFSFAITCSWILTGLQPYGEDHKVKFTELPNLIKEGKRPYLPPECHGTLSSLLHRCWHRIPSERPSFADICDQLRLLKATLLTGTRSSYFFLQTEKIMFFKVHRIWQCFGFNY